MNGQYGYQNQTGNGFVANGGGYVPRKYVAGGGSGPVPQARPWPQQMPVGYPQPVGAPVAPQVHVVAGVGQGLHGGDGARYVRQQRGHSIIKHLLLGWAVMYIPTIYYAVSKNHYFHM